MACRYITLSAVPSAVICCHSSIRASDLKISEQTKKASSVLETILEMILEPLEPIVQTRILDKMRDLRDNPEHPLQSTVIHQEHLQSEATSDPSCPQL